MSGADRVFEKALDVILGHLTSRSDRNSASLVSKAWCAAEARTRPDVFVGNCYAVSPGRVVARFPNAKSFVLKGRPHFADFNLVPSGWGARLAPWLAAFAPAYPGLEKLWIKRMEITDDDLFAIARSFPSFKDLVMVCCDGFSTRGLASIAENCWELRVLDLVDDDVDDDGGVDWVSQFPEGSTKLESLVFDCVESEVDFDQLEALVARSPNLKKLKLNQYVDATQLPRLMAVAPQLTYLGTGSFHSADGDDEDCLPPLVSAFSASNSLVGLAGFRNIAPEYLPAIYPVCANLTTLNLSYAEITCKELKPVISHCHNLRVFWVLDSVRDEGLTAVAATCKILEELRVFPSVPKEDIESPVSDVGLIAISEGCPKLRRILYFCQSMTNAALVTTSKNCPHLVVFRLCIMERYRADRVTGEPMDEGFGAIVMNCRNLARLSVSGLLTDKAFEYIGKYGKSLRTLSVAFAGDSDQGLAHVLQGCPELKKLEIRDCPFGDSALLSSIGHYYNMRFLWMSACKLSLKACREVAKKLPELVVEVIKDTYDEGDGEQQDKNGEAVQTLYMYRTVAGPRTDLPPFVQIL